MNQKIFKYKMRMKSGYMRFAILGMVLLAVVIASSVKNYIDFRDSLIVREQNQLLTIAESVARILSEFVDNKAEDAKTLNRLITDQISQDGPEDYNQRIVKPLLQNYLEVQQGEVFIIEWLSPVGESLSVYRDTSKVNVSREELHDAPIPENLEKTYIGKVEEGRDGKLYLDILEPVDIQGQRLGIIRFVISLDQLYEEYVREIRAGDKGYASLKDSNGILIMHPSKGDIGQNVIEVRKQTYPDYDWSELEEIVEHQKKGESGVGIYHSVWSHDKIKRRVKKFNGYAPVRIGDDFWIVNVSMDYRELVDIVNRHLYTSMVMIGAIPVVFIIISVYYFNLKRNLEQLEIEHNYVEKLNKLNKELELDIEQRKKLEVELKQSRRRFRTLFNAGVDLTFVLERSERGEWIITDINDRACEMLGRDREALTSAPFLSIDHKTKAPFLESIISDMESSANVQFETALLKNDMQMFPVEINGNLFSFQGNKYVMLIARDITERLTQKEELERHRAMAIYKNRMAAVGEMVANIAHQWRQPLSSLNLMLSNLEDAYETDTLDAEYFNRQMQKSCGIIQRMSEIIDEFRYFFSPKGQRKSFAVQESMRQVEEMVHDRLRIESVQLHVSRETEDDLVYGYPNQLSQVLLNLISNAMDAFSDISGEKLIHVDIDETEDFVVVSVKDNAGGIEDDVLPKLFEPYFTTKAENGGTGIGLYMSKMIIESKFAGKIQARRIDKGLSFTIELPKYNQGDDTWNS